MSTQFVFSEYLDSVTRAFDLARNSYRLVFVVCATLVVFAIQGEPYKGSKKYLNHLMQAKADIDEASGWIKGLQVVREASNENALGEPIAEAESMKRKDLSSLYADIRGVQNEADTFEEQLKDGQLTEKDVRDALASELAKQYQFGVAAGLKVPLLDIVLERERIPALFSILVAIFVALMSLSLQNLKHALQLFLCEAEGAGLGKKAVDLLSMRGLSMLVSYGGVDTWLQLTMIWAVHLIPSLLVAYAVIGVWSESANQTRVVYSIGFIVTLWGCLSCARSWTLIREMATQARVTAGIKRFP